MKKLYGAEVCGRFVFVVDSTKNKEFGFSLENEAFKCLPSNTGIDWDIESVSEIEEWSDIPAGWKWNKPLGTEDQSDCDSYFEGQEETETVVAKLKEFGHNLEEAFVDDLREAIKEILP